MDHPEASAQIGVVDLAVKNDVQTELKLRPAAIRTLELLAERGGEVPWSWDSVRPETREMVADMITEGLVREIEYVTHALQVSGRLAIRLTDKGRNVLEAHRRMKIEIKGSGEVKPIGGAD